MKRLSLAMMSLAVAGLMTMVSCRKPNVENITGAPRTVTFTATTQSNDGSKTTLVNDGDVMWSSGDVIYVNGTGTGNQLTLSSGATTTEGTFSSKNFTATAPYMVAYPMPSAISQNQITFNLPANQDGNDATLSGRIPMAAYTTEEGKLSFKNAVNVLKLWLKGNSTSDDPASKLTSIVLSHASANLNGDITVEIDGSNNPTFSTASNGTKKTTVNFAGGLQLKSDVDNYVYIILPRIESGDITIKFYCANSKYMQTTFPYQSEFNSVNYIISHNKALTVNATTQSAQAPTVKNTLVKCSSECIYANTFGGTVYVEAEQECELGVVYSSSVQMPTLEDDDCYNDCMTATVPKGNKNFSVDVTHMTSGPYYVRAYAIGENGIPQYASKATLYTAGDEPVALADSWIDGVSPYEFTVLSTGKKVRFSRGNLQYIGSASPAYWKFADHQFDIIGSGQYSSTQDDPSKDRDLFGWGTSGWSGCKNYYYQPYNTSSLFYKHIEGFGYGPKEQKTTTYGQTYYDCSINLTGDYANSDWGVYNTIKSGTTPTTGWRTLSYDEWWYLFDDENKAKWSEGRVGNCTPGVIILPDNWSWTGDVQDFQSRWGNGGALHYSVTFTYAEWSKMEAAGAVFLPATGVRNFDGNSPVGDVLYVDRLLNVGLIGYYWSSSYNYGGNYLSHGCWINEESINYLAISHKSIGHSVRLVKDVTSK